MTLQSEKDGALVAVILMIMTVVIVRVIVVLVVMENESSTGPLYRELVMQEAR